jgi:hypothetical protein
MGWLLDLIPFRAERKLGQVCSDEQYAKVFDRLNSLPSRVEHLIIQLGDSPHMLLSLQARLTASTGIPIAYPRMVFLENALSSKFSPFVALGKLGPKGFMNRFNGDAELLDDLVFIFCFFHLHSELIVCFFKIKKRMIIGRPHTTRSLFCI